MNVLGVSALYHDSAACLVVDGAIIAAAQEERFTRKKHDPRIPVHAIRYCLKEGNLSIQDLDYIVYYDNPLLTLDRFLHNLVAVYPDGGNLIEKEAKKMFSAKIWVHKLIMQSFPELEVSDGVKFLTTKHHVAHAASAFLPSPHRKAVIITNDGVGEWTTLSIGVGDGNQIDIKEELRFPHSLGLFYSAFTYFCGFKVNSGDYKFMGLAPYGNACYYDVIKKNMIDIREDGSFRLNLEYFDFQNGRTMVNEKKMAELFGGGRRLPETEITKREMDIAASVQRITEEIILKIARYAKERYGKETDALCMAGGVSLNCVANGKLLHSGIFQNIWVQPASGDAGGALGAALYAYYQLSDAERHLDGVHDLQKGSFLGPEYEDSEIREFLKALDITFHEPTELDRTIAELLVDGKVIGLFVDRMEYGPRALGHRSIIADPRSQTMQSKLNLKIKYRESFRPFAPSVLEEDLQQYFELETSSPYMLFCAQVKEERCIEQDLGELLKHNHMNMLPVVNCRRSDIPAVTHVDYSARIQTVNDEINPKYAAILRKFKELSGCSVLVNTSFNVRGEPIVCSPMDAYRCFMYTDMDVLVLGRYVLYKGEQKPAEKTCGMRCNYEPD